jgi:carotenoid cleavage dioxygenase-like enzyme
MAAGDVAPVDPSTIVHLTGAFAPVDDEIDVADLPVKGHLPDDLQGAYVRNGPNPKFPPLGSYTYPLDGDGMLHGVWIEDGTARYRNRYVYTKGLEAEIRAGRALWGGVMTPVTPAPDLAGADADPGGFKLLPDIHIVRHAALDLALCESTPPYEVRADLTTVGRYEFAGALPLGMCAHPKIDPVNGEMILFRYGITEPYLYWASVGADGRVTHGPDVVAEVDRGFMIHDFVVTEDYLVLFINPATLDLDVAMKGGNPLAWRPELGTRIAVIPRAGEAKDARWIDTDAFWVWHFANAWQEGDYIVTHFPWWSSMSLSGQDPMASHGSHVASARIDPAKGTIRLATLVEGATEFPRIDDRRQTRPSQYMYLAHKSDAAIRNAVPSGAFDELLRVDLKTETTEVHSFPGHLVGEPVFAPKTGRDEEDAGYVVAFVTDLTSQRSQFVIIDVANFTGGPAATVTLPRRVPAGLHGNWFPG